MVDSDATRIKDISVVKNYKTRDIEEVFIATNPALVPNEMYKHFIDNGICITISTEKLFGIETENAFAQRVGNYQGLSVDVFSYDTNKIGYFFVKRFVDFKRNVFKGIILFLGIAEGNVAEFDVAAHLVKLDRIGRISFGLAIHYLNKALKSGNSVLVLLHKSDKSVNRRDEKIYRNEKCRVFGDRYSAGVYKKSARDKNDDVENIGYKAGN